MTVQELSIAPEVVPVSVRGSRTWIFALITIILFASAFPAIRVGLAAGISPVHVALVRYLVAATALAIFAIIRRMPLPHRADLPRLALAGLIGFTLYNALLNTGEVTVPSAVASFIVAAAPIFIALLATFFLHERLRLFGWIGIGVCFLGVSIIAFGGGTAGLSFDPRAILILLGAFAQSLYSVGQKPLLKIYTPLQFTSYAIWFGALFLLVFTPGLGTELKVASPGALTALVYLGIFPGAIGYITWSQVLSKLPASRAGVFLYVVPVIALFIAWLWLGEIPGTIALFGGLLILAGVITVNTLGRAQK